MMDVVFSLMQSVTRKQRHSLKCYRLRAGQKVPESYSLVCSGGVRVPISEFMKYTLVDVLSNSSTRFYHDIETFVGSSKVHSYQLREITTKHLPNSVAFVTTYVATIWPVGDKPND